MILQSKVLPLAMYENSYYGSYDMTCGLQGQYGGVGPTANKLPMVTLPYLYHCFEATGATNGHAHDINGPFYTWKDLMTDISTNTGFGTYCGISSTDTYKEYISKIAGATGFWNTSPPAACTTFGQPTRVISFSATDPNGNKFIDYILPWGQQYNRFRSTNQAPTWGGCCGFKLGGVGWGFDPYTNLEFNLQEPKFGQINSYWFNKVNPEDPKGILQLSTESSNPSVYPKINELAIAKRPLYTFMSNWDIDYYFKSINKNTLVSKIGYSGVLENKSFFGSKIMEIPDTITLENFVSLDLSELDGGLPNISNVSENVIRQDLSTTFNQGPPSSPSPTDRTQMILDVFSTKALTKYLRANGFDGEFNTYINPLFSYGESGLDDDINNYISNNIFDRYVVKRVVFYENTFSNNTYSLPTLDLTLTNTQLFSKGYNFSENCNIKFSSSEPLDFRLIYNIPKLDKYSISFKVELEKK